MGLRNTSMSKNAQIEDTNLILQELYIENLFSVHKAPQYSDTE